MVIDQSYHFTGQYILSVIFTYSNPFYLNIDGEGGICIKQLRYVLN